MLDTAKRLLQQTLSELAPQIRAAVPMVGLEPSCLAVFRDEMVSMLPNDWDAKRLHQQCFTISEFLEKQNRLSSFPKLERKAVVHGHCHHKAIMTMEAEERLFHQIGLDFHVLDSGCCGMAGSFGFEKDHYEVSVACAERVLIPAVRHAEDTTLIVADGFSCREQISQMTNREARHTAEVLQMAIHGGAEPRPARRALRLGWAVGALAGLAAGFLFTRRLRSQ